MESNAYELNLNEVELKKLIITIEQIYKKNYFKHLLDFYNLFKIKVLKQVIYENKYFIDYKKLYALRNIIIYFSLKSYNQNNFKRIIFNSWNNNIKMCILKTDKNKKIEYLQLKREAFLRKIILNKILKVTKINHKANTVKNYFLLLMKYYMYLFDRYYIRSIKLAKSMYNYVRKKMKPIKSIFFVRLDFNPTEEDIINIYKYILINYNKVEYNQKNKKDMALSLINAYNNTIKHNYDNLVTELYKQNNIYIILYKTIFSRKLINKIISSKFSLWKQNSLNESVLINFQLKEKYTNNLIFSKIYMFILVIKKIIKNYFESLYNNIYSKQINGIILLNKDALLSILNFESLYDNYLINVLKGIYKLGIFKIMNYSRIFKMSNKNKKKISLNIWKNDKNIICNYLNNDIKLYNYQIDITKGAYIFDKIYMPSHNKRINTKINSLLIYYAYNHNRKFIYLKLIILFNILQKRIIYKRKKIFFNFIFEDFKLSEEEKIWKKKLSLFAQSLKSIFSIDNFKLKTNFFLLLKRNSKKKYPSKNINHKNIQNIPNYKTEYNFNANKLKEKRFSALNIIMKFLVKNSIKSHFHHSLKNAFNQWSLLSGNIPQIIKEINNNNIFNDESEDEEDIITQRNEIKDIQKCLKEDKDFQHDLKMKITALDEENEFVCEKIYEITQRVERCEKCLNLLKSSNISDNKVRSPKGDIININNSINNNNNKSRNMNPIEGTMSSGLNFITGGTDLVPRKPQASLNHYEEVSDPGSEQMEDIDENEMESVNMSHPYLMGIKQKIYDLKQEKEPIVNKLKEEIKSLYLELNMT